MRHTVRRSGVRGYFALAAMMVAMAIAMIAAPISTQSASAQDTTIQTRAVFCTPDQMSTRSRLSLWRH